MFLLQKMSETIRIETVFIKEESGTVDVKDELVEEKDPLNLDKGNKLVGSFYLYTLTIS